MRPKHGNDWYGPMITHPLSERLIPVRVTRCSQHALGERRGVATETDKFKKERTAGCSHGNRRVSVLDAVVSGSDWSEEGGFILECRGLTFDLVKIKAQEQKQQKTKDGTIWFLKTRRRRRSETLIDRSFLRFNIKLKRTSRCAAATGNAFKYLSVTRSAWFVLREVAGGWWGEEKQT